MQPVIALCFLLHSVMWVSSRMSDMRKDMRNRVKAPPTPKTPTDVEDGQNIKLILDSDIPETIRDLSRNFDDAMASSIRMKKIRAALATQVGPNGG